MCVDASLLILEGSTRIIPKSNASPLCATQNKAANRMQGVFRLQGDGGARLPEIVLEHNRKKSKKHFPPFIALSLEGMMMDLNKARMHVYLSVCLLSCV